MGGWSSLAMVQQYQSPVEASMLAAAAALAKAWRPVKPKGLKASKPPKERRQPRRKAKPVLGGPSVSASFQPQSGGPAGPKQFGGPAGGPAVIPRATRSVPMRPASTKERRGTSATATTTYQGSGGANG
jgi:hypothetical protein